MEQKNVLQYVIIGLLVSIIGLLLFENHQLDSIKHAVGVEESVFEERLHDETQERAEATMENLENAEENHVD